MDQLLAKHVLREGAATPSEFVSIVIQECSAIRPWEMLRRAENAQWVNTARLERGSAKHVLVASTQTSKAALVATHVIQAGMRP